MVLIRNQKSYQYYYKNWILEIIIICLRHHYKYNNICAILNHVCKKVTIQNKQFKPMTVKRLINKYNLYKISKNNIYNVSIKPYSKKEFNVDQKRIYKLITKF